MVSFLGVVWFVFFLKVQEIRGRVDLLDVILQWT